ncbi:MAG: hypothetical protein NUV65_00285 [Candidatus Roizmanbacteria bacterium]|nr:hypothetical protein [Candidatus Roizmanbacteria bacterium]
MQYFLKTNVKSPIILITIASIFLIGLSIFLFFNSKNQIIKCDLFKNEANKSIDCGIVEVDTGKSVYKIVGRVQKTIRTRNDARFILLLKNESGETKSANFTYLFNQLSDKNVAITKIKGNSFFEHRETWTGGLYTPIDAETLLKEKKEVVVVVRSYTPALIALAKKKFQQSKYLNCLSGNTKNLLNVLHTAPVNKLPDDFCPIIISQIYYVE